jgi:hypothetical protein|tara:strand:+ start:841 stop:1842 length:1002 start_codon:yes stop_codon:yes gene_type:complete
MPTESPNEKPLEKEQKTVPLDTSGPGAEVIVPDEVDESEVEAKDKEPTVTYTEPEKEEVEAKEPETIKEIKKEQKQEDSKLEEYSKGVQGRIAKLTRKMREAERQRDSATEYARALESQRHDDQKQFKKLDSDYWKRFETNVKTGMESAQRDLAGAIEAGDAKAQVEANKRIATLAFENAKMEQAKEGREDVKLSDGGKLPTQTPRDLPYQQPADPRAEDWAGKNRWFGQDRAMTFTAFEIHKDLVEKEGFDPKSNEYYEEVDKRIRVDFPHKFGKSETIQTTRPVQSVASANRSVKPGRQTVKLTPSQVAIAKKLGVPLEDYAKQLKLTKEV